MPGKRANISDNLSIEFIWLETVKFFLGFAVIRVIYFHKSIEASVVVQRGDTQRAVSMLGDNQLLPLNLPHLAIFIADIVLSRMDEHHQVGVLLDRTGITKVGEFGLAAAGLHRAGELGERQDRDIELASQ